MASRLQRHLIAHRACSWFLADNPNKMIAVARFYGRRTWLLRIPGYEWPVTQEMGVAKFLAIPGTVGLKSVVVKAFSSIKSCETEVNRVLKSQNIEI